MFNIHSWLNNLILNIIFLFDNILSIIIEINIIKNKAVEIAPKEDREFHIIKLSENIRYRRGIPFKPIKCWGKNVKLIEINILIKLIFNMFLFIIKLNISGNQKIILERIENTTPIERT